MAERGLKIIDKIVIDFTGGLIDNDNWIIPVSNFVVKKDKVKETFIRWKTIEDSDRRWVFDGFNTKINQWNASGATLSFGYQNCKAEISFNGTAVQYYAYKSPKGGDIQIIFDGKNYGKFSLQNESSKYGQYYVKIFEKLDLKPKKHKLMIIGDSKTTEKTIDMLSIIPSSSNIKK